MKTTGRWIDVPEQRIVTMHKGERVTTIIPAKRMWCKAAVKPVVAKGAHKARTIATVGGQSCLTMSPGALSMTGVYSATRDRALNLARAGQMVSAIANGRFK